MKELANEMTMTSREIAELVESRHDSVKRTIETLRNRGLVRFSQSVTAPAHVRCWSSA
jgi:phage regulator Rha-like protein